MKETYVAMGSRPCGEYRLKITLLGPVATYNVAFWEKIIEVRLPYLTKKIIGVTIGSLRARSTQVPSRPSVDVHISLWDISCSPRFSWLRTQYCMGASATLVILDEHTLDQAGPYCVEILQNDAPTSIGLVVLHEGKDALASVSDLKGPAFAPFTRKDLQQPREVIEWALKKFFRKKDGNLPQHAVDILFLPRATLVAPHALAPQYWEYTLPTAPLDVLNPTLPLNGPILIQLVRELGFPVHDDATVINTNKGEFRISLRDGRVYYTPQRCLCCTRGCPKREFICIVACSQGFSSNPAITQPELLVLSKILALREGTLPDHVIQQITRLEKCQRASFS